MRIISLGRSSFSRHSLLFCPLPPPKKIAEKRQAKRALFSCARLANALTAFAELPQSQRSRSLSVLFFPTRRPKIAFSVTQPHSYIILRSAPVELSIVFSTY